MTYVICTSAGPVSVDAMGHCYNKHHVDPRRPKPSHAYARLCYARWNLSVDAKPPVCTGYYYPDTHPFRRSVAFVDICKVIE